MRTGRRVRGRPVPPLPVEHEPAQLARRRGIRLSTLVHQPGDGPIHRQRHLHRPEGRTLREDRRKAGEDGLHGQTARPGGPDQRDEIQPHALHRPHETRRGDHAPGHQHHGQHQRLHTQGAPDRRLLDQIRTQPADRDHRVRLLPARRHPQGLSAHRRRPDPQRRGRHARSARGQRTGRDQGKPGRRRRTDSHGDL